MKLRACIPLLSALAILATAASARGTELVTNGNFEQTTKGPGQFDNKTTAVGWSSSGYNFIFTPGSADTTGVTGQYGNLKLWGPGDGANNGLPATSPTGGNFVGADGAYDVAAIKQTINGLTPGAKYRVSFWWADAQQYTFSGPTTEKWTVTLGSQSRTTQVVDNVNHGFSGWIRQTFTYTAAQGSEVLSFLATGTPTGVPPFALLDGVSMTEVPEPAGWAVAVVGLAGLAVVVRRRRRTRTSAEPTPT